MDHDQWLEPHDRMMADLDQKMAVSQERHDREMAAIRRVVRDVDQVFRRAIQAGIREARSERAKRRRTPAEIDDRITRLAAAQLITEEMLRSLLERDKRRYGGNGSPPAGF